MKCAISFLFLVVSIPSFAGNYKCPGSLEELEAQASSSQTFIDNYEREHRYLQLDLNDAYASLSGLNESVTVFNGDMEAYSEAQRHEGSIIDRAQARIAAHNAERERAQEMLNAKSRCETEIAEQRHTWEHNARKLTQLRATLSADHQVPLCRSGNLNSNSTLTIQIQRHIAVPAGDVDYSLPLGEFSNNEGLSVSCEMRIPRNDQFRSVLGLGTRIDFNFIKVGPSESQSNSRQIIFSQSGSKEGVRIECETPVESSEIRNRSNDNSLVHFVMGQLNTMPRTIATSYDGHPVCRFLNRPEVRVQEREARSDVTTREREQEATSVLSSGEERTTRASIEE